MDLKLADSDVVVFSMAAACVAAAVLLEILRLVIADIYEWVADYRQILRETKEGRGDVERLLAANREQAMIRDRRNAERFRLKSSLSRSEMERANLERARIEIWHEVGERAIGDQCFVARIQNRPLADQAAQNYDSAPAIWRYVNHARIWAATDRMAQQMLITAFPKALGYACGEVMAAPAVPGGEGAA